MGKLIRSDLLTPSTLRPTLTYRMAFWFTDAVSSLVIRALGLFGNGLSMLLFERSLSSYPVQFSRGQSSCFTRTTVFLEEDEGPPFQEILVQLFGTNQSLKDCGPPWTDTLLLPLKQLGRYLEKVDQHQTETESFSSSLGPVVWYEPAFA